MSRRAVWVFTLVLVADAMLVNGRPPALSLGSRQRAPRACLQRVAAWGGRAHVGAMRRLDVTDEQWRRLEPLLPPEKPRTGRPNHDHGRVVSGMLWIHRTGAPWRDLPERYGPAGTGSSRFYRWG